MPDDRGHLRALIAAAGRDDLGRELADRCRPDHASDCHRPVAAQWLRRWRPARGYAIDHACSCPAGRCATCN